MIAEFFHHNDVATLTIKSLFDFLTDPTITLDNMEICLDKLQTNMVNDPLTNEEIVEQEVFKNAYIPKNLNEVYNIIQYIYHFICIHLGLNTFALKIGC